MTKVLLLNQGHTSNYGDIAINQTINEALISSGIEACFFPFWSAEKVFGKLATNKLFIRIAHEIPFITDYFYKKYFCRSIDIHEYDAIVIGGGELIGGHYGFNSALYVISSIADKINIPIYLYGVSGSRKSLRWMYARRNTVSFSRVTKVFVRDSVSKELVINMYKYQKCVEYPDAVYAYNLFFNSREYPSTRKGIVVVPISYISQLRIGMRFVSVDNYCEYLTELVRDRSLNNETITVTSSCQDDELFNRYFCDYLNTKISAQTVRYVSYSSLDDYIDIISEAKVVISGRMHAMIIALLFGCKVVPIPFKDKLICFEKTIAHNYDEKISKLAYDGLIELCHEIIEDQKEIS